MKLNRQETHDRLLSFKQQADYISKGCEECIRNRPDQFTMPFYIFAHTRNIEADERISIYESDVLHGMIDPMYVRQYNVLGDVPTARLIWTPRLSKPTPQQNSMLFKAYPPTDNVKVIWMLPAKELWDQYLKGNMLQNEMVVQSINMFKTDFATMSLPEEDDLPDARVNDIYANIASTYGGKKFQMI
jgi:hypothetical protein